MSTRGSCSTVSQSQLVRGPSVRAHSTTVSPAPHGIARVGPSVTCGGARKDVSRLRACSRSRPAGGFRRRVPPCASRGRSRGRHPLKGVVDGSASIQYVIVKTPILDTRTLEVERRAPARPGAPGSPGDFARPGPPRRSRARQRAATRGPSRCRSDVLYKVYHTHWEALSFLSCVLNMSTQHSSSSRAQRVIAQLSQGRQSRI
jgi:hypothetical protein